MYSDNELYKAMNEACKNFEFMSKELNLEKLPIEEHFVIEEIFNYYKGYVENEYNDIIDYAKQNAYDFEHYTDYELFQMNDINYDEKHFITFIKELNRYVSKQLDYFKKNKRVSEARFSDLRYQKDVINKILKKIEKMNSEEEDVFCRK